MKGHSIHAIPPCCHTEYIKVVASPYPEFWFSPSRLSGRRDTAHLLHHSPSHQLVIPTAVDSVHHKSTTTNSHQSNRHIPTMIPTLLLFTFPLIVNAQSTDPIITSFRSFNLTNCDEKSWETGYNLSLSQATGDCMGLYESESVSVGFLDPKCRGTLFYYLFSLLSKHRLGTCKMALEIKGKRYGMRMVTWARCLVASVRLEGKREKKEDYKERGRWMNANVDIVTIYLEQGCTDPGVGIGVGGCFSDAEKGLHGYRIDCPWW